MSEQKQIAEVSGYSPNIFLSFFKHPAFQSLAETRGTKKSTFYPQEYKKVERELKEDNNLKNRCGIYFTPNGEFFGKPDRRSGIAGPYSYLVLDFDNIKEEERVSFFQKILDASDFFNIDGPTFIVETGNGFHVYYRFERPIPIEKSVVYKSIFEYFTKFIDKEKGDLSCKDVTRLFRLPGYQYWKDNRGDFTIRVVYAEPQHTVSWEKLLLIVQNENSYKSAMEKEKAEAPLIIQKVSGRETFDVHDYYERTNMIRIDDVLSTLGYQWSGASLADTSTGEISDGWKINHRENYVNNFTATKSGRPIGPPFSFALRHFKGEMRETTDFFQKHFGIESPYTISPEKKNTETGEIERKEESQNVISLFDNRTGSLVLIEKEKHQMQCQVDPKSKMQVISNFYIEPIASVMNNDSTSAGGCLIQCIGKYGKSPVFQMPPDPSPSQFTKSLRRMGMFTFNGNSNAFHMVVENVYQGAAQRRAYANPTTGFNKRMNFIARNFIYFTGEKEPFSPLHDTDIMARDEFLGSIKMSDRETNMTHAQAIISYDKSQLKKTVSESKEIVREELEKLEKIYDSQIVVPLFLVSMVGLLSPILRSNSIPVPYGFLFGLTQSGKTTLSDIIRERIIGDTTEKMSAATTTLLPFQQAMRHGKPTFIGEYRANSPIIREKMQGILRDLYDGTSSMRGRVDMTIMEMEMVGNAIVDGESIMDDPATFSRGIFLHCKNIYKGDVNVRRKLRNIMIPFLKIVEDHLAKDGDYFKNAFLDVLQDEKDFLHDDLKESIGGEGSRVIDNFALLTAVAEMLGFERVNIRKKMRGTIISQLNRISRKSASKTMIWALAGMMRYTSDGDSSFINGFPDGKGGGTIIVKTNTLISYMSINKNKHPEEIESLLESLHGEAGIHCVSGAVYFDLNNIKTEQYLLESFLHALANKKYHNEHFTREDEKMMELLRDIISAPGKIIKNIFNNA